MSDRKVTIDITAEDNTSAIVRKIGNAFDSLTGKTRSSSKASKELGGAFDAATARMVKFGVAYLSATQVAAFAKGCFDAAVSMDKLSKSYESITGSGYAAQQQLDFVLETSRKLGLEYESTAEAAKTFFSSATGTELEKDMNRIFTSVSKAGTALALSSDQMQGIFLALGQMVGKGKVQAEELRGQLGERLPGAFQLAAKAMGMTTAELDKFMADGKLTAEDLLPKLADALENRFGAAAESAAGGAQQAVNRLSTEWTLFKANILDVKPIIDAVNSVSSVLQELSQYANLRSVSGTFAQGAKLANEGKLDWDKFKGASFLDRQRMVDSILNPSTEIEDMRIANMQALEKQKTLLAERTLSAMRQSFSVLDKTPEVQLANLKKQYSSSMEKIDAGITYSKGKGESEEIIKGYYDNRLKVTEYYTAKIVEAEKKLNTGGSAGAIEKLNAEIIKLTMTDKHFREWELTNVTLPELMEKTGGATEQVEAFAKAQREAWAKSDAEDALKKQNAEMEKYTKAVSQLDVEIARLSMSDKAFREWELTTVTLPRLMEETHGATDKVKAFAEAQRQAWANEDADKARDKLKEHLETQSRFYEELAEKSGSYDLTMKSLNETIAKQTELWKLAGIPDEYLAQWERLIRLEAARDPMSGIERGWQKYVVTATDSADQMESAFTEAFTTLGNIGGSALEEVFENGSFAADKFFANLTRQLAVQAANAATNQLVGGIFKLIGMGLGSLFGGEVGAGRGYAGWDAALGQWVDNVPWHHSGGIVGMGGAFSRSVPLSFFEGAPRFHSGGLLRPDERPIIAQTGERILSRGQTADYDGLGAKLDRIAALLTDQASNGGGGTSVVLVDDQRKVKNYLMSTEGQKTFVALLNGNRASVQNVAKGGRA